MGINVREYLKNEEFMNELISGTSVDVLKKLKDYVVNYTGYDKNNIIGNIVGTNFEKGENSKIKPPVIIGDNVITLERAIIYPYTIIGDNCKIGAGSIIENSIIFPNSKIGNMCYIKDSIIGENTVIGTGTVISAQSYNDEIITININGNIIKLDINSIGLILGDGSVLGECTQVLPGTHVGTNSCVLSFNKINGYIEDNLLYDGTQFTKKKGFK